VGRSVSMPSSPRCLWCSMWYFCSGRQHSQVYTIRGEVYLERRTVRDPDGQVREQSQRLVRADALEREVVRDLVDREEQVVVRRAADDIRQCDERPPAPPAHGVREPELERDDTRDDELGARLVAHQARDLRVCGEDRAPARAVRLLRVQPKEVRRVLRRVHMLVGGLHAHAPRGPALGERLGAAVQRIVGSYEISESYPEDEGTWPTSVLCRTHGRRRRRGVVAVELQQGPDGRTGVLGDETCVAMIVPPSLGPLASSHAVVPSSYTRVKRQQVVPAPWLLPIRSSLPCTARSTPQTRSGC
jgi:hypothetical protein